MGRAGGGAWGEARGSGVGGRMQGEAGQGQGQEARGQGGGEGVMEEREWGRARRM